MGIVLILVVSYDAHPMSMLTSAFAMLGSYYSEANPSLQGRLELLWLDSVNHAIHRSAPVHQG